MGKWLERKTNWLNNGHNANDNFQEKIIGRPPNDSEDYGVTFIPLRCPKCRSKKIRCYKTEIPKRYHICYTCGWRFKSIEIEEE